MRDAAVLADAFRRACIAELHALKPGNVHIHSGGHDMVAAQFEAAAEAAAPFVAAVGLGIGERIERAVEASMAAAGCNTNLGILLLAAPLMAAAERGGDLRDSLGQVLAGLDLEDAAAAYRGIRLAAPGGLGGAREHDVAAPPTVTLLDAMRTAAGRDTIALQYITGFSDVFAGAAGLAARGGLPPEAVIEAVYLDFLASRPDTHLTRKFGAETGESVRAEAADLRRLIDSKPMERKNILRAFDRSLKARGLNPGTSADLTVASLLAADLSGIFEVPRY